MTNQNLASIHLQLEHQCIKENAPVACMYTTEYLVIYTIADTALRDVCVRRVRRGYHRHGSRCPLQIRSTPRLNTSAIAGVGTTDPSLMLYRGPGIGVTSKRETWDVVSSYRHSCDPLFHPLFPVDSCDKMQRVVCIRVQPRERVM
jgi:hypothetical protein